MNEIEKAIEQLTTQIRCTVNTVSIKSCEVAIEALEKQLPRKPEKPERVNEEIGLYTYKCVCGRYLTIGTHYCPLCGKTILWEEEE